MEKPFVLVLYFGSGFLDVVKGFPIDVSSLDTEPNPLWLTSYFFTIIGFLLTFIVLLFGCVCCRNSKGFKEFSNSSGSLTNIQNEGFVNQNSELTIFPPAGVNSNPISHFEPLPDLKCQVPNLRPAAFSCSEQELSSQDWFSEPNSNFPRSQLKYVEEYGRGWFGRVVQGEAQNITSKEKLSKVMVKILHEDATLTDQVYFLHEVKFYKDLKHPNILRLLGRCLETEPFLIILECYPNGDLKTFLSQNLASARALVEQGVTLQMCYNITSGLQFMHENKFIHTDLAARNCLVGPDLTIKIGDYGNSIENFKSDYYCAGSVALPVRWCAPETLKCTDVTIETREVTPPANIWSLAVVYWEIYEFCKLPYAELNDDEVIVRVLGDKNYFLEKPSMFSLYKDELYHLMKLCWNPPLQRPTASQLKVILDNLMSSGKVAVKEFHIDSKRTLQDFEQRWQNLKPNSIPKKDNAVDNDCNVNCSIMASKLKNAKIVDSSFVDSPLGLFMSNKNSGQESPRVCLKSNKKEANEEQEESDKNSKKAPTEEIKCNDQSENLNERGEKTNFELNAETNFPEISDTSRKFKTLEGEVDSWLKGVEINNEEDESFVRKISEAIRDLDAALALEKTSSSEEDSGSSSHQTSPSKDFKANNETVVEFKLGSDVSLMNFTQKSFELTSLQNSEQPQSLNFTDPFLHERRHDITLTTDHQLKNYVLDESLKEADSLIGRQSRTSSDTDDEIWRKRVERGEISEKVKEKSKSIANLMILTHIDASDDSDTDLDKVSDKNMGRSSFRRSGSFVRSSLSSNIFGSENDIKNAVLEDDFKESLKKLSNDHKEYGYFDSLGMILPTSAKRESVWENLLKKPNWDSEISSETETQLQTDLKKDTSTLKDDTLHTLVSSDSEQTSKISNHFLGNVASEKLCDNKSEEANYANELVERLKKENGCCEKGSQIVASNDLIATSISSKENSSHLKDFVKEGITAEFNDSTGMLLNAEDDLSSFLNSKSEKMTDSLDSFSSFERKNHDSGVHFSSDDVPNSVSDYSECHELSTDVTAAVKEKLSPSLSAGPKNDEGVVAEETNSCQSVTNIESSIPEILITEATGTCAIDADDIEKLPELNLTNINVKPFKFVLKEDEILPEPSHKTNNRHESQKHQDNLPFEPTAFECETVIIGPCEDYTLDYYKGLKTTSEDINFTNIPITNERNKNSDLNEEKCLEKYENDTVEWDKHLDDALTQQVKNKNFQDITFGSLECAVEKKDFENDTETMVLCPVEVIQDFLESEKSHSNGLLEMTDLNRISNIGMTNEEEYDNFKLRTPDDERSSDSGFRDKGSLSESVEDACEGKYNLEDIEAELEEAYVKGVFGNCDGEEEKPVDVKNSSNNFEFEEPKFYEEKNKNEDTFSDIDGEIEFWQNKDNADYYPEISEFNPNCSSGWYLHPPEENADLYDRNVNEDIVNAIRNELRENLPVQTRTFDDFNYDFYETSVDDSVRELNLHSIGDISVPLSPIIEEHDNSLSETMKKNIKNSMFDENHSNKIRRNVVNLMESVKSIDTNTFRQYLDYMIENEGRDIDVLDEIRNEEENEPYSLLIMDNNFEEAKVEEQKENFDVSKASAEGTPSASAYNKQNDKNLTSIEGDRITKVQRKTENVVSETEDFKAETTAENNIDNECSVLSPELLSPDQERSLSEISSSNGTRTGDALSEITLSSPDLVPDCFSNSVQESVQNLDTVNDLATREKFGKAVGELLIGKLSKENISHAALNSSSQKTFLSKEKKRQVAQADMDSVRDVDVPECDLYEMSTSFMGDDDESEGGEKPRKAKDTVANLENGESVLRDEKESTKADDNDIGDWDSECSTAEEEETSCSSGEFIWKDGDKVSKLKAVDVSESTTESSLFDDLEKNDVVGIVNEANADIIEKDRREKNDEEEDENDEGDDDDEDDDNESSTGSSASFTDFVPSAWNSQALPGRSVLRSLNKTSDEQQKKKNVWFKKQKYHCVYEYPREPSDSESADSYSQFNSSDPVNKHFTYGLNDQSNKSFPLNAIDYSSFTDWDILEGDEGELSLTDTDSDNGLGKSDVNNRTEANFYNLSPFDYDFCSTGSSGNESEFLVSSSSRPFQMGTSSQFFPGLNQYAIINNSDDLKNTKSDKSDLESDTSRDFTTPDSGLEDSTNVSPLDKKEALTPEEILLRMENLTDSKEGVLTNILDNLKFNFTPEIIEGKTYETADNNNSGLNSFSDSQTGRISPRGLGELRHARDKLKLDLPFNYNAELGAIVNKKINKIH